jgi:transposase
MVNPNGQELIIIRHKAGYKVRQIAEELNFSQGTIRKYIQQKEIESEGLLPIKDPNQIKDHTQEQVLMIKKCVKKRGYTTKKIHRLLVEKFDYQKSYSTLNNIINTKINRNGDDKRRITKIVTEPGEEAQIDWGTIDWIDLQNKKCKLKVFVYILSYSRMIYAEFVPSEDAKILRQCMQNAFHRLGIPKTILTDNMKTACIKRSNSGRNADITWNKFYIESAKFYGFKPKLCTPHRPQEKGKVESAVKLIKKDFMQGRNFKRKSFDTLKEINQELGDWIVYANGRNHRGIGCRPIDRWSKERPLLKFPDLKRTLNVSPILDKWVTKDGMVRHNYAYYETPLQFAGKKVQVCEYREDGIKNLRVYFANRVIADHKMTTQRNAWIMLEDRVKKRNFEEKKNAWSKETPVYSLLGYEKLISRKEYSHGQK